MSMFECERVQTPEQTPEDEPMSRHFPTYLRCDIDVIVLDLEFRSWHREDGYAIYSDINSHQESFKVFNNDGKFVADIRED